MNKKKDILLKIVSVLLALAVWQTVSVIADSFLFASPTETARRLFELLTEGETYKTIWFSSWRIFIGFALSFAAGLLLGILAGKFKPVEYLLKPYAVTIKSVPVASFAVIALIWLPSRMFSVLTVFLISVPIIYNNVLTAIKNVDLNMTEMCDMYCVPNAKRIRYIWIPQIKPYLVSGAAVAFGMSWKAGIAAEVIGMADSSIGGAIYESKVWMDSASLFAWTFIIVILSLICEKAFSLVLKKLFELNEKRRITATEAKNG